VWTSCQRLFPVLTSYLQYCGKTRQTPQHMNTTSKECTCCIITVFSGLQTGLVRVRCSRCWTTRACPAALCPRRGSHLWSFVSSHFPQTPPGARGSPRPATRSPLASDSPFLRASRFATPRARLNSIQFNCRAHFLKLQMCLRVLYNLYT